MNEKFYLFRDKKLLGHKCVNTPIDFYATGCVEMIFDLQSPAGKDMTVYFINPFTGLKNYTWRASDDVELIEVDAMTYSIATNLLNNISEE